MTPHRSRLGWSAMVVIGQAVALAQEPPCRLPFVVVDTGQAACYDNRREITPPGPGQPFHGQDAQHLGVQPAYRLSADGLTVHDLNTGLTWQRSPDTTGDGTLDRGDKLTLAQARLLPATLNAARFGGFDDWRLPNVKELQSIVDYTRSPGTTAAPAIDPLFACTPITNEAGQADYACYWSSTTHAGLRGGEAAMYVAFGRAAGWLSPRPPAGGPPGAGAHAAGVGEYRLVDVHGAGAQRSDPKAGDPAAFPHGRGPQGDVIRIRNLVRLVRGGAADTE